MFVLLSDEPVPVGCMVVNSITKLKPLSQSSSLFSLPSAPTMADLDYGEDESEGEIGFGFVFMMNLTARIESPSLVSVLSLLFYS